MPEEAAINADQNPAGQKPTGRSPAGQGPEGRGPSPTPASNVVQNISLRRRLMDHVMTGAAVLTVILVLAPLVAIFGYLVYRGVGSINWAFLTHIPAPEGEVGGGMANAIVGSVLILGIASL